MRKRIFEPDPRRHLSLVTSGKASSISTCLWHGAPEAFEVDIREVRSSADRKALERFRHRVTVMDMNRRQAPYSHQSYTHEDNLSNDGVQLTASYQSEVVGTIQVNYAMARDLGIDADFYRMREAAGDNHPSGTCIFSRLLVDPGHRGGTVGQRLCLAAYKHALGENARSAFLRCSDPLVFYFSALGFKSYIGKTWHAQYGEVLPMKLDLLDEKYLAMINSPLVTALRAWKGARVPDVHIKPGRHDPGYKP